MSSRRLSRPPRAGARPGRRLQVVQRCRLMLMPSTPSVYPQVASRRFATIRVDSRNQIHCFRRSSGFLGRGRFPAPPPDISRRPTTSTSTRGAGRGRPPLGGRSLTWPILLIWMCTLWGKIWVTGACGRFRDPDRWSDHAFMVPDRKPHLLTAGVVGARGGVRMVVPEQVGRRSLTTSRGLLIQTFG